MSIEVVHVTSVMPVAGGVSTHITTLVGGQLADGHQVSVLTPLGRSSQFGEVRPALRAVLTRLTRNTIFFMALYHLARYILKVRFAWLNRPTANAVVNAHDVSAALAVMRSCRKRKFPLVLTLHGYLTYEAISDGKLRPGGFWARVLLNDERRAYTAADAIICVDQRLADHVTALCKEPPSITVLPNAVDTGVFRYDSTWRVKTRRQLEIGDERIVLCPRRLVRKNGVDVAIEAMSLVLRELPGVLLLVAGDGQERQVLEKQVHLCGVAANVRLLGTVDYGFMNHLYCASDVVIVPSVEVDGVAEATSRSALEAMACSRPVIASSIGGLAELITSGDDGILVPPGDPVSLAQAITRLLSDSALAARFGKRARQTVVSAFRVRYYSRSITDVYARAWTKVRPASP